MDREFLAAIEDPDNLNLQRLLSNSKEAVEEELAENQVTELTDTTLTRFSYTYYHDWISDDPDYVILLEDPGLPGEHVVTEAHHIDEAAGSQPNRDLLAIFRRFGARWLMQSRYTDFTHDFVKSCADEGLIDVELPWWKYILSYEFFDDFYMADVVKYRAQSLKSGDIQAAFTEQLIHELEYVDPDFIFTFGKRAWTTLHSRLGLEFQDSNADPDIMEEVHGNPAESTRLLDTTVIPAGHMSPNFRYPLGHDTYMSRLKAGIVRSA